MATGTRHTFFVRRVPTMLRLKLLLAEPVDFELSIDGVPVLSDTTDGSAPIVQEIAPTAKTAELTIWHPGTTPRTKANGFTVPIDIALLGPVDLLGGAEGRLRNLDFLHGALATNATVSPETTEAIKRFERALGVPEKGVLNASVHAQLIKRHDDA